VNRDISRRHTTKSITLPHPNKNKVSGLATAFTLFGKIASTEACRQLFPAETALDTASLRLQKRLFSFSPAIAVFSLSRPSLYLRRIPFEMAYAASHILCSAEPVRTSR